MRRIKATCTPLILLACLYTSQPLLAGPLDRMDTGPRVNPATNDMLRVPGVVGMDYQSALATLEQAGLNPRVHMLHKQNGKYAGQEGTVVKQLPVAGGMAMLGSSVSISVFAPDNGRGAGNGMPDQGPPYDQGNGDINMGGAGPAPGQDVPAAGDNGQGGTGIGGNVPPPPPVGGGWQGPTDGSAPGQEPEAPAGKPVLHPVMVEPPTIAEKKTAPVVKEPVKRPGTASRKPGRGPSAANPPSEPERQKTPVGKAPVKKHEQNAEAPGNGGSGKTFKPIDWGRKMPGGDSQPSVPKKPEGHYVPLGSHQGAFDR